MKNFDFEFLIILAICVFFIAIYKFIIVIRLRNFAPPIIDAANLNLSSAKIDEWIKKLKKQYNIEEYTVIYGKSNQYANFLEIVNKRKKTIYIPKWEFNSVGYEIDYIFATMFSAARIIRKAGHFRLFNFLSNWLLLICQLILLLSFSIHAIYYFTTKFINIEIYYEHYKIFNFYSKVPIFQFFGVASFITILLIIFIFDRSLKKRIEFDYSNSINEFVKNECVGYIKDFTAARTFSTNYSWMYNCQSLKVNKKTNKLAYIGPFTFQ